MTRRKARQFYRESRRRCREFGGPRNRDGGGGDKRRDPRASNDKIDLTGATRDESLPRHHCGAAGPQALEARAPASAPETRC